MEDVWRRAGVPVAALTHIAAADGFQGLGVSRREAIWAIKGLHDEALPLFAAADDRAGHLQPELILVSRYPTGDDGRPRSSS